MEYDPGTGMIFDEEVEYTDPPINGIADGGPSIEESVRNVILEGIPEWIRVEPTCITDLQGEEVTWLWTGFLARESATLFNGIFKAGKSTLMGHLLKQMEYGGELAGQEVKPGRVLIITEENKGLWKRRREDLNLGPHVKTFCRTYPKFMRRDWLHFIAWLVHLVKRDGYGMVIIDPISSFWPVLKENDAGEVMAAVTPLHEITRTGAALLLIHHSRKSDGSEGNMGRGSSALPGWADIIIEFRRLKPDERDDRRRTLTTYSRFDESPTDVVIELDGDNYRMVGSKGEANRLDRRKAIMELLPQAAPGWSAKEVREAWPAEPAPAERTLRRELEAMKANGELQSVGEGTKTSPRTYWTEKK